MYQHHKDSIKNLIDLYSYNESVIAIILGGSIAKGEEKETSDIDVMVILTDEELKEKLAQNKRSECIFGYCTYEGGYFDVKYFNKEFLIHAVESGSEPTRNSFIGAKCIYSKDESIEMLIRQIPIYQKQEKQEKINSFFSALMLNNIFFWQESIKRNDIYLKTRVASDIVLFGLRLILVYNEHFFPCQKWLISTVEKMPNKPDGIIKMAYNLLENPNEENKNLFVNNILEFADWGVKVPDDFGLILSKFIEDNELWWHGNRPNIAEW